MYVSEGVRGKKAEGPTLRPLLDDLLHGELLRRSEHLGSSAVVGRLDGSADVSSVVGLGVDERVDGLGRDGSVEGVRAVLLLRKRAEQVSESRWRTRARLAPSWEPSQSQSSACSCKWLNKRVSNSRWKD